MAGDIHVGDTGTELIATIKEKGSAVDVSMATNLQMVFRKPNGTTAEKTAVLHTDGKNGKVLYVTEAAFVSDSGQWQVQAKATIGSWTGRSDIHAFVVAANLS